MSANITTADQAIEAMKSLERQFGGKFVSIESMRRGRIVQAYGLQGFGFTSEDEYTAIRQAAEDMGLTAYPNMISWHE